MGPAMTTPRGVPSKVFANALVLEGSRVAIGWSSRIGADFGEMERHNFCSKGSLNGQSR